jgi:hypothetical protein
MTSRIIHNTEAISIGSSGRALSALTRRNLPFVSFARSACHSGVSKTSGRPNNQALLAWEDRKINKRSVTVLPSSAFFSNVFSEGYHCAISVIFVSFLTFQYLGGSERNATLVRITSDSQPPTNGQRLCLANDLYDTANILYIFIRVRRKIHWRRTEILRFT